MILRGNGCRHERELSGNGSLRARRCSIDEYRSYLLHLKIRIPGYFRGAYSKSDGSEVRASDEKDEMDIYRKLQYYELFDHGTVN